MRNLILVLAITNLVSLWKPLDLYRRIAEELVNNQGSMTCNIFWLTPILSITISLMLVRYFHYAYLRYKYSLEDYQDLRSNTTYIISRYRTYTEYTNRTHPLGPVLFDCNAIFYLGFQEAL